MRKLTALEITMLGFLEAEGPLCPGSDNDRKTVVLRKICDGLVRKKRATMEPTDDGPRYTALPEAR